MTTFTQVLTWELQEAPPEQPGVVFTQDIAWTLGVAEQGIPLELVLTGAPTGLVGVLTIEILASDGLTIVLAPTAQDIVEIPAGTGRYVATVTRPPVGDYFVVWSDGTTTTQTGLKVLFGSTIQTPIRATSFSEYTIKAGDTEPGLVVTLRNAGGTPVDLSSAMSVTTSVLRKGDLIPVVDHRAAAILEPAEDGQVLLGWQDGDTNLPGVYYAEFGILWPGNGRTTAPTTATYRFAILAPGI